MLNELKFFQKKFVVADDDNDDNAKDSINFWYLLLLGNEILDNHSQKGAS